MQKINKPLAGKEMAQGLGCMAVIVVSIVIGVFGFFSGDGKLKEQPSLNRVQDYLHDTSLKRNGGANIEDIRARQAEGKKIQKKLIPYVKSYITQKLINKRYYVAGTFEMPEVNDDIENAREYGQKWKYSMWHNFTADGIKYDIQFYLDEYNEVVFYEITTPSPLPYGAPILDHPLRHRY